MNYWETPGLFVSVKCLRMFRLSRAKHVKISSLITMLLKAFCSSVCHMPALSRKWFFDSFTRKEKKKKNLYSLIVQLIHLCVKITFVNAMFFYNYLLQVFFKSLSILWLFLTEVNMVLNMNTYFGKGFFLRKNHKNSRAHTHFGEHSRCKSSNSPQVW